MVKERQFREDLWFRVNVFPIRIPSLKERREDIPALVHHFVKRKTQELKLPNSPALARGAIDRLMAYDWPGNVRELENLVERALILSQGSPLTFDDLSKGSEKTRPSSPAGPEDTTLELDAVVSSHIRRVLEMAEGRVHGKGGAAELLGMNPSTLRYRMDQLGIPYGRKSAR
jgi:DNA-binding NtrC family response regulator